MQVTMSKQHCKPPTLNEKRWSATLRHLDTFFNEVMEKKSTNVSGNILAEVNMLESDVGCSRLDYRLHQDRCKIAGFINDWRDDCIAEQEQQRSRHARQKKPIPRDEKINCGVFTEVIDALADTWNCDIERTAEKIIDTGSRKSTRCAYVLTDDELQRLEKRAKNPDNKASVGEVLQWLQATYKK